MFESTPESRPVDIDRPVFSRARYDAIVAILGGLRDMETEEAERAAQQALELLDPRWTAERWAEVRGRLAPGRSPREGGLKDAVAQVVAIFGPVVLTEESRRRAKARLADAEARRRPRAGEERRRRLSGPRLTAGERAELDARYEAAAADGERRAGPRDEAVRLDGETHRKLMSLAILQRATLSETVADLIDDAYEQREWAEVRSRRRAEARQAAAGEPGPDDRS